jgi:hypothetical protein
MQIIIGVHTVMIVFLYLIAALICKGIVLHVYLISGDGNGAGKTTLARRLVGEPGVRSLAQALRNEVMAEYPGYDWHSKCQRYKTETRVKEAGGRTVREVLVDWGEGKCAVDSLHYARRLVDHLANLNRWIVGPKSVAVDDVRKLVELEHLKGHFPEAVHIHLVNPAAGKEPQYQNDELAARADYIITWRSS